MNEMLDVVRKKSCIMDTTIRYYGEAPLKEYVGLFQPHQGQPPQSAEDFLMLSKEYNEELLGKEVALELDKILRFPLLNTANHHGVDFFPPSVQGNLLFWQALKKNGIKIKYLPICSFGIVSLSNSSYARGITSHSLCEKAFRIPIFPKSIENKMVRYVAAFTEEQVKRTIFRLNTEFKDKKAGPAISRALEKYYLDKDVLAQEYYGSQAVLINRMISRDMYPEEDIPEIIYMEMEQIINRLLVKDLMDENSMIYRFLFDTRLLEGIRRLMNQGECCLTTMFFWGRDHAGRRYPLDFCSDGFMRGITLSGETVELSASPKDLLDLLEQDKVVPSGYTMAVLLNFARGYTWLGGYFQGDYLPGWQRGTAYVLNEVKEYQSWAEYIMNYSGSGYISGPVFALSRTEDGLLVPAGPLEIIENGGINLNTLDRLMDATVEEAHVMGLYSAYPELVPPAERVLGWSRRIGENLMKSCQAYVVPGCLREYKKSRVHGRENKAVCNI